MFIYTIQGVPERMCFIHNLMPPPPLPGTCLLPQEMCTAVGWNSLRSLATNGNLPGGGKSGLRQIMKCLRKTKFMWNSLSITFNPCGSIITIGILTISLHWYFDWHCHSWHFFIFSCQFWSLFQIKIIIIILDGF